MMKALVHCSLIQSGRIVLLSGVLFLAGCATPSSNLNSLEKGLSKAQVIQLLGPPNATSQVADRQFLDYTFAQYSDPLATAFGETQVTPYYIVLEEGLVTEWGPKDQILAPSSTTSNVNAHVQGRDAY